MQADSPDIPTATAPPAAEIATPMRELRLRFTGAAGEYFRIWIVNVCLSIFTLGIYSAWAKVRNKRYFYGHTLLDGSSFDYLANPLNILKGRLIVAAVLIAYGLTSNLWPPVDFLWTVVVLPLLLPWVIVKARSFNARYSSYRGLRFAFSGTWAGAFAAYIALTVVAVFTAGLAYPYAVYRRKAFLVSNAHFGCTRFRFRGGPGRFYVIYLAAYLTALVVAAVLTVLASPMLDGIAAGMRALEGQADGRASREAIMAASAAAVMLLWIALPAFLVAGVYVQTAVSNYVWSNTWLGESRFRMALSFWAVLWLYASNMVAIALSIGLLIPWARVRMARYRIERLSVESRQDLDTHLGAERERLAALGEEFGDALDLDLGI